MANCRKGMVKMSEVKMTREEIYSKLSEKIQEELDRIRNDYEFGVIEKAEFDEMTDEVEQTYIDCLESMALASDDEVKEKMAFILDFKTNTRKIKGL